MEVHDVDLIELRVGRDESGRNDREVLRQVVGDREGRDRAACNEQLLADADDLDQLRRVGVEVDHVGRFLRRCGAGVHGEPDVGLSERGGVVRAVAGHRDEVALGLEVADDVDLVLWLGLGDEIVHAGLLRDGGRRQLVVACDHDRADAHAAELGKALAHARLHGVLEVDRGD